MLAYDNCPNCFMPMSGGSVCANCGNDYSQNKKYSGVLPAFTLLNNKYLIGRVLGRGGFGVTYIAKDIVKNSICAVKEYMPSEYSTRNERSKDIIPFSDTRAQNIFERGRGRFIEEAKTLLKLRDNPVVVDILDFFTQNNTAYLVMEYLDGQDLRKMAKSKGGVIESDFAKAIFVIIASSLMEIHRIHILHRDISPENIIVTNDGAIKLIDFGAAKNFVSTQNKGMSVLLKPGFAPLEQYSSQGVQGPWTDVYALCATFYTLVSGKPVIDAQLRARGLEQPTLQSLGCMVTKKTSDVINRGMQMDYKRRYRDFKELLSDIDVDATFDNLSKSQQPSQRHKKGFDQCGAKIQYIAAIIGNSTCNKVAVDTNDIFKIGRSAQSCKYVVAGDTNISRIHCYLRIDGKNVYLCDTSSNGTFFENGRRLEKNKEYKIEAETRFYLATRNHMLIFGVEERA